ncbi:MAG: polysaccharide deacetylase family protein [Candidatus Brocadiae bacterium]|nr:polysaccharide deacetylase family protein [Candidatus Brocadiia bacterium]
MIDPLSLCVGAAAAGAAVLGAFVRGVVHPRSSLLGRVRWHGDRSAPRVALTFDDGPHPDATPAILDVLAEHEVRAAFFVIGRHAERWPHLVRRMADEGHLIGNHSFDHHHWGMLGSARYWRDQIERTQSLVETHAGIRPAYFRPPMGLKSPSLTRAVRDCGLEQVTFSVRGFDGFRTTSERVLERMVPVAAPGDILTLHDGRDPWVDRPRLAARDAVAPLIRRLRERGLEPVRLDELLESPVVERTESPSESPSVRDLPVGA